jgi:flagellar biosynthesis/type III secretory pathway protein FliH
MSAVVKGHAPPPPPGARIAAAAVAARADAARRLAAADEEARALVERARAEAARIRGEAAATGREDGLASASEVVARAVAERDRLLAGAEADLVELAFEIARRVVDRAADRGAVVIAARRALEAARARARLTVRVHPADLEALRAAEGELCATLQNARGFALRGDASVARGGAVVETEAGTIDARIETQLAALRRAVVAGGTP